MSDETLTLEMMRDDIARAVRMPPEAVTDDENLVDLGLDSLQAMDLLTKWEKLQPGLDYTAFMERETLGEWWEIVARVRA
ncbi:phosphopantetheine-binding protein [Allosediminivita pacifica]|uniref:Aryl carrier-like protein n=1 Tax=Allosediminivita pacifica TaxID=1267769 RepID=A0A2T6AW69_9RHOB|nr:phosphopantetheine-binding protein [Allosediminivita pacifica]PTX48057.1 aryl carrier-like protein [Allosediminivita pacifica]GGB11894.1 hypothetical protein GCM10011324_22510 [Allosediminivita pacifica]